MQISIRYRVHSLQRASAYMEALAVLIIVTLSIVLIQKQISNQRALLRSLKRVLNSVQLPTGIECGAAPQLSTRVNCSIDVPIKIDFMSQEGTYEARRPW